MRETLKRIKADITLTAILCIALGIVVMVWPAQTTKLLCWILAVILIIMGISRVIAYMRNRLESRFGLSAGVVLCILGVWILIRPLNFARLFPIVVGILLLMHGLEDLRMTLEAKAYGDSIWWVLLLITVINFAAGILLVWKAFEMVQIAMILLGAALVYDGATDLFVVYRVAKSMKENGEA